jgi:anaerobic C4-dicarboxylate transporter
MTPLWQFVALLALHWIADFVLQTHWQATNKSKNNEALAAHVGSYSLALLIGSALIFGQSAAWLYFVAINAVLHFATDYFTSRASSRLYAKQDWHNFFVVIGFDQLIHQATLAVTMTIILN